MCVKFVFLRTEDIINSFLFPFLVFLLIIKQDKRSGMGQQEEFGMVHDFRTGAIRFEHSRRTPPVRSPRPRGARGPRNYRFFFRFPIYPKSSPRHALQHLGARGRGRGTPNDDFRMFSGDLLQTFCVSTCSSISPTNLYSDVILFVLLYINFVCIV